MARDTHCLLPGYCGLCQIRAEQAAEGRAAYRGNQRAIGRALWPVHAGRPLSAESKATRALAALVTLGGRASTPKVREAMSAAGPEEVTAHDAWNALHALAGRKPSPVIRQPGPVEPGHAAVWELAAEAEAG